MSGTNYHKLSDAEVIDCFLAGGDKQYLSVLYQRYATDVYRKCIAMVKNDEIAKDLTHDIFLKAFLKLADLKEKNSFKYWIKTIAYHSCIDYLNLKKSIQTGSLDENKEIRSDDSESEEKILQEIDLQQLEILLEKLPDADRLILLMRYQDDLSLKEIQDTLGIGISAAKMRLKRAKEKLAELFQQHKKEMI
ncbi:MAG: sigma-70 family RNA polymerase sigma factor [Microscillaceae bacterium]|nr:sigma-70 family RNA polymerase sigma factor [Microscillaceae bacterium]